MPMKIHAAEFIERRYPIPAVETTASHLVRRSYFLHEPSRAEPSPVLAQAITGWRSARGEDLDWVAC